MIKVEIESEFDGDEFIRGVLENFADQVREKLRGLTCPDHGEPPSVVLSADESGDVGIQIGGCCDRLSPQVEAALADLS